jgi:hypothetical protein
MSNFKLIVFWMLSALCSGCSHMTDPSFEATVIRTDGGGDSERVEGDMPESWVKSSEGTPYFTTPAAEMPDAMGTEGENDEPVFLGGVGSASLGRVTSSPYGIPVPGKKNLVRSPFSDQGFVDISGHPTETEVKCPYTGKVFLVP